MQWISLWVSLIQRFLNQWDTRIRFWTWTRLLCLLHRTMQGKHLKIVGRCTVRIRKSTGYTKHATCAMTVTASRKVLKPVIIIEGTQHGRIVTRGQIMRRTWCTFVNALLGWIKRQWLCGLTGCFSHTLKPHHLE
jgi:hypothetical protein